MRLRLAVIIGVVLCVAGLGFAYAVWLSRAAQETLPEASELPIRCKPSREGIGVILPTAESELVYMSRCRLPRRSTPHGWDPSPNDVATLESKLPAFWRLQRSEPQVKPLESYVRQYAGFEMNGRKGICVNLVDVAVIEQDAEMYRNVREWRAKLPRGVCPEDYWRHEPISADDGGVHFCGVTYDIDSGGVSDLNCNGL